MPWKRRLVQRAASRIHFSCGSPSWNLHSEYFVDLLNPVWSQQGVFPPVSVIAPCVLEFSDGTAGAELHTVKLQGLIPGDGSLVSSPSSSSLQSLGLQQEIKGCRKATFGL